MRGYTVYRVDYGKGRKEAIGSIVERREKERTQGKNLLDLLVEARRLFGRERQETLSIVLDPPRDALEIGPMELSRGIRTIASRG